MSATAKTKPSQPTLVTTGRGAAFSITLGIVLLTLGAAWLLSLFSGGSSYVLSEMAQALEGLGGGLYLPLPFLACWIGVKLLVSARHRVAARDVLLVSALYLLTLAGYTLIARVSQSGAALSFMDFVGKQNYKTMETGYASYSAYLRQAYALRASGAGGLLGMLVAYPVWRVLGRVVGVFFVAVLLLLLLALLVRFKPGEAFERASQRGEKRRQERAMARAAQPGQAVEDAPTPQPPQPDAYPMQPLRPGQQVDRQDTVYSQPPAYYQPAPVYEACPPAPARPGALEKDGFYAVQPDLYDERFPLHEPGENAPVPAEAVEAPQAPAPQEQRASHLTRAWDSEPEEAKEEIEEPQPAPEPEIAPPQPPRPARVISTFPERKEEAPQAPAPEKPSRQSAPPRQTDEGRRPAPVRTSAADVDTPPWEGPEEDAEPSQPAAPIQAEKPRPAAADWASQVRRREAELTRNDMPEHTTRRGEPKPVYTDPVMPITGERIAVSPRSAEPRADARMDGTLAPKVRQSEMQLALPYQAPPMRLLNESKIVPQADAAQEDERRAHIIEGTLGSFGVEAEVRQIMHGPSITRFAIQIAPGVRVNRVTSTADNLALELKTRHVRVEAPIQGTSYIGIEVPNARVSTVSLREVLDSEEMRNNPSPLAVALGKDIAGTPVLCDLSKMPHLLIAGATGSGKSVCINSIVCSLLYRTSPDQVRLIMIDPKQVELSVYNSIPHLLVPVVSDPKKAAGALAWVVQEMLERYGKFSAQNVRNLAGYNKANQGTDKVLPNIVVIIDEMADLMEVCRKDVEESIRRLAALARAAGIYMVLATQRPSVDVITGVIKNNIPSRIAFAVSSGTDSRTIIDINGAEKLMGKGDMLYKPAGTSPLRVQGCLVTDDEVNAITDFMAKRYQTDYDPNIIEHLDAAGREKPEADEIGGEEDESEEGTDDLLREAIEMAVEDGQTSTSMLQRRLRVGYARAGRLVDEMEKRGIVSHSEGSKPRKTLITREQYYELFRDE